MQVNNIQTPIVNVNDPSAMDGLRRQQMEQNNQLQQIQKDNQIQQKQLEEAKNIQHQQQQKQHIAQQVAMATGAGVNLNLMA